jgi:UDP-glucose 4-epimerase
MATYLITGAAGFFGSILARHLAAKGHRLVLLDRLPITQAPAGSSPHLCDLRNAQDVSAIFEKHRFDGVFHVAAILAHDKKNHNILWDSNVTATRTLKNLCKKHDVPSLVFTSTNCLWARDFPEPVGESERPEPVEIYGRSKLEAERILLEEPGSVHSVIIRCPTIVDAGRLGLLSILFEFIEEGKKVWTIGLGDNRYQFIYADDLTAACEAAISYKKSALFHIGSDNVPSMRKMYQDVIARVGSASRVASLPAFPFLSLMKLAYFLGVSPLGPYHYKMIASNFIFDTSHIKKELIWAPTLNNIDMLVKAYEYFARNKEQLARDKEASVSAHNKLSDMGIIRLLKWVS